MRIALGIVKLFPEGGLQRDCVRLARILAARGHDVTIFTSENKWPFDRPPCRFELLPVRARVATKAERDRLWPLAEEAWPGYRTYQKRSQGREIQMVILEPR